VVRAGRVRAGGDDGEVHVLVPPLEDAPAQVGRDLGLGAPDQRYGTGLQLGGDGVDRRTGGTQRLDLGGVLAGPQLTEHPVGPAEGGARQRHLEVEDEAGPCPVADGQRPACDRSDEAGHDVDGIVGLVPGPQREHVGALDHPGSLEPGDHQHGVAVLGQHQHGQPLEGHGRVAGQPGQVGAHRQQQDVDALLHHLVAGPGHAFGEHHPILPARSRPPAGP
jgi:hypothetical protein